MENELISKSYFHTMVEKSAERHPMEVLGEKYIEEMQKESIELSSIRFAQGEVYFLHHDYEAAIFKWENVSEERLIPWAQKNIADAYFEMGLFDNAEEFYKIVETNSVALKTEVLLQLFSLYVRQDRREQAIEAIKEAVRLNPDYSNVTEIARTFFENYEDWDNAMELAINESIRTEALEGFEVLEKYAEQGFAATKEPKELHDVLVTLLQVDTFQFECLVTELWDNYKETDFYFDWLEEINELLLQHQVDEAYTWHKLPILFEDTYFELISGEFLIRDFSKLMPSHLQNWMKVASDSDSICASGVLAWNEVFPSELDLDLVREAERRLAHSEKQDSRQAGIMLYESIEKWADKEGLLEDLSLYMEPLLEESNIEVASPRRVRNVIQHAIEFLLEKQVETEKNIIEKINWNEELLARLNGLQHQLDDRQGEEARAIKGSYHDIKEAFRQNMLQKIPELLRNCSDMVNEESDFGKLHVNLNEEMNKRIAAYIENTALPEFKRSMQEWIIGCEGEFKESQGYLDEMSESFNNLYGEEKLVLDCDFKVLDDWRRDMDRISRGMTQVEQLNIMLRNNPAQLFLKSTGRLLGSISKNKEKLVAKYKGFVENEDYSHVTEEIIRPFMQQLELFEGSVEWDVKQFFANPFDVLHDVREETQTDVEKHKQALNSMRENPEQYQDPLTLFKLQLVQYELIHALDELTIES
ncbi:hypothetical protein NC661_19515 [Aquibacillus koreensis]|uniref:GTP-binding protein n=1 Tax=Aquibacillus koreensis TaxID=279446 RepID=A0A9X4ALK6_9BACI|nr:hypothetical protein [Aquibacillus koreensis]MCT2535380.1 hypothetical protein [Aquibacillus koreensis]MDC3422545.1 hypothetical protein [Aquibacillus koreensis]